MTEPGTGLFRIAAECLKKIPIFITKVISPWPDEVGGCSRTPAKDKGFAGEGSPHPYKERIPWPSVF